MIETPSVRVSFHTVSLTRLQVRSKVFLEPATATAVHFSHGFPETTAYPPIMEIRTRNETIKIINYLLKFVAPRIARRL